MQLLASDAPGAPTEDRATPSAATMGRRDTALRSRIIEMFRGLPLSFEANQGQADPQVDFIARGGGYTIFLTPREVVLLLDGPAAVMAMPRGPSQPAVVRLQLVGASARSQGVGLDELPGRVNYLHGNDPAQWRTNIRSYARVRHEEIYPGIDLVYHGTQRYLEYDFIVRPGGDPARIALAVNGAKKIEVDPKGDLLLHLEGGMIRHKKPVIYQDAGGLQREIAGGYVLQGPGQVGFAVAAYDHNRPLVIDPVLYYSTYLGGADDDDAGGIAVDADGFAYITGGTKSANFPTAGGVIQPVSAGLTDAFVAKLDPAGSALVYSTYLGGAGDENGRDIAIDASGNAYVTGTTTSANFPTTTGAFQAARTGTTVVAFVAKLNPTGSALVYSTYLGGTTADEGRSIAVDGNGHAYVTGRTASPDFPTTAGVLQAVRPGGLSDGFVTKLDPTGTSLVYSTYLGGTADDDSRCIAIDAGGNVYVTGETGSTDFPATPGAFQGAQAGTALDAYVAKLNPTGSALVYASYLGGTGPDSGFAITVDALSTPNAYVAGGTASIDFPTTAGAFQPTRAGIGATFDVFVTKVAPNGAALAYSTYLGGSGTDEALRVAVDAAGHAYVTGFTESADFPTAAALQAVHGGLRDAFVTKLNPNGSAPVYSTYLGGTGNDTSFGIAVDAAGSAYVIGETSSADFATTAGAFDTTFNGIEDAFVLKIADFGPAATLALAPSAATKVVNTEHCVTATVQDAAARQVNGATVRFAVTGAHSVNGTLRTNAGGQAAFCYTGTQVGQDTITAFADTNNNGAQNPGEPGGTVTTNWTAGPPASLTLAPDVATNPVNTQHCVTATVRDAAGNPVSGASVLFSVTGSVTTTGTAPTNAGGQAQFCYMGPAVQGSDTIAAFADANSNGVQDAGEPGGTAAKTWAVPASLTLLPDAATNLVNTQHCVTATVGDASGIPIPRVTVRFAVTGSVTTAGTAPTNAGGQAQFCYMGPAVQGSDTIAAFADTNNNSLQDAGEPGGTATKTWAVPASLTLAPNAAAGPINTRQCVTATVGDSSGAPVPGVPVLFSVTGSVTTAGTAPTNAGGQAQFCYMGPSVQGSDTIAAFADTNSNGLQDAGEPGNTATKTWNPPAALTLVPAAATNVVNTQHCVTATVGDGAGTPVPGVTVPFAVTGSVTASGSATTNAGGQAQFCYMGPSAQGNDTIAAFADTNSNGLQDAGEPGNTATKTWALPASLALAPGAATNLVNTQHCVTATVGDTAGNPVPGVTARFAVTGSVTAAGAATTNAGGQAQFCYMGPSAQGNDTIAAFADTNNSGVQDPGEPGSTAAKTWAAPVSLTLTPTMATNPINTQHCVTATVGDSSGTPVPGVTVRFTVTGSVTAAGSATTTGNGQAGFCYMGPAAQGTDAIAAFADTNNSGAQDAGEPGSTATKRWAVPAGCGPTPGINEPTNRIYTANSCGNTVSVISGATNAVIATITVGRGPIAVGVNELTNRIFVANYDNGLGNTMSVINGNTNAVVATVAVGPGPIAVEINEVTNRIYVVNSNGTVSVISGSTNAVIATVPVGPQPAAIGVNELRNRIYVANSNGTLSVIDGAANAVVATITVGAGPVAVEVDEQANRIFVANYDNGLGHTMSVIDGATNVVVATVTVGPGPIALSLMERSNQVYVANYDSGFGSTVSVISERTNAIIATVTVGQGPAVLGRNTVTNRIYSANDNGTVSVIDVATNAVFATVTTGQRPMGVEVNEDTNRIFVTNANGTVSVIDGATNAVIATVPVGPGSMAAGINRSLSGAVLGEGTPE